MRKLSLLILLSFLSVITASNKALAAYCTPSYYDPSYSCFSMGADISQFRIVGASGTLNDVTSCTGGGYEDQTSVTTLTCSMMQSIAYTATVAASGFSSMNAQVWIDFNNNTTFEATEIVGGTNGYYYTTTFSITIPLTAPAGTHRMRIVTDVNGTDPSYPTINSCASGCYFGDARDYNITITAVSGCTGTPSGGTATTTSAYVCPAASFTLSLTGSTAASGITYQWQDSLVSGTWANISGATNLTQVLTATATKYYRCVVRCTTSSITAYSTAVLVNYLPACYCIPYFGSASAACYTYGMDFARYNINGETSTSINDIAACNGTGYLDRTALSCNLKQSITYVATIYNTGTYSMNTQTWIDFNDNGTFDAAESVGGYNAYSSMVAYNITIPVSAAPGMHRMRVLQVYSSPTYPGLIPCPTTSSGYTYGEARDYMINVVPLPPCTSTPTGGSASASVTLACPSTPFNLICSGFSAAGSLLFQWQDSTASGSWANITGATSYISAVTASSPKWYRCIVTCSTTSTSGYSTPVFVNYLGICFCNPSFTSASLACSSYHMDIRRFKIVGYSGSTLNDTSACSASTGYRDFSSTFSIDMQPATTYNATINTTGPSYLMNYQVWIDFNNDGTFASSETVGGLNNVSSTSTGATTITIPFGITLGAHRMRIVGHYNGYSYAFPTMDPCTTGYIYGDARDYTVNIVPLPACTGTPTPGVVATTSATACPALNFTLSPSGSTIAGSLGFQWQKSTDSSSWTSISGATNFYYTTSETASTYYRCIITCTASGSSAPTPGLLIPYMSACYCTPSYSSGAASCATYDFALSGFKVYGDLGTSVVDNAACMGGTSYQNRTGLSVTFMQSVVYMATVTPNTATTTGTAYTLSNQIWIDFNDNAVFESSERVGGKYPYSCFASTIDSISIPLTANPGRHRMRLVQAYSGTTYPSMNPCPGYTYGEARDYTANIIPLPPCAGTPSPGSSVSAVGTACPSYPITLTLAGYALASGLGYQWQVSADSSTWTNITGATTMTTTTTETGPRWYRCVVTCTTSGGSAMSVPVYVDYLGYCYCSPSYTGASTACTTGMGTSRYKYPGVYSTMINDSSACNGTSNYENLTGLNCNLFRGATYVATITWTGTAAMNVQSWVDYNDNGTFETSESIGGINGASGTASYNTYIPTGAALGPHRMRTVTSYAGSGYTYASLDPCCIYSGTPYALGDARDYTVNIILPGCTGSPTAGTTAATIVSGCTGFSTTLSLPGGTVGGGIAYQWQTSSDSSTWTNISSATSATYSTTVSVPNVYYRALITCTYTSSSAISIPIGLHATPVPSTITGSPYVCGGASTTMSSTPPGGAWSTTSTSFATINASTGVLTGIATGTALITYTLPSGCAAYGSIIVNPSPLAITGTPNMCVGATTTLADASTGGTWSSANTAIATVSTSGVVYGVTAGTVLISYTLSTGCSGPSPTATRSVTVNPLPAAITGTSALCVGYPVTLSSTTTGGTWSAGTPSIASVVTTTGSVTGVTSGTARITYTVTSTGCMTSTSVTVNPVVVPTLNVNITPSANVCAGTTINCNAVTTNPGSSPLYVWKVNGVVRGGGSSFAYVPTNGDVVTCWFYSSATCAYPDSLSISNTIIVNPIVTPAVTMTTGVGDTVCTGSLTTLTALPTGGGTAPSYSWFVNGSAVGTTAGTYAYVPANGDVITVKLYSNSVCRTADSAAGSKTLTVANYVTPGIRVATSTATTVCAGTSVTYSATSLTGGGTAPAYDWFVNGTHVATGITYSYVPANADNISLTLTSNFPCVTTPTASDNVTMTVLPTTVPVGTVSVSPGYIVLPGTLATFTCNIVSGGGSAPLFQWILNSVPVVGATNSTWSTSTLNNGDVVSCNVTNTDPCSSVTSFSSITMTVGTNVSVNNVNASAANVTVLPNPNNGTFTIKGNIGSTADEAVDIQITDMLGQVIYREKAKAVKGELAHPVSLSGSLANGMYMISVKSEHINGTLHFILGH